MYKFKCILFDLDGTLIDTTPLILESYRHTFLTHFNEVRKDEEILKYVGIPLKNSFAKLCPESADALFKTYREFNQRKHDAYIGVFIGITDALRQLKQRNILLGVVTSKMGDLAMRGMRIFGIDEYMDVLVGLEDTERHKPEGEPVLKALERLGLEEKDEVLYVGDSTHDIFSAKNAGVRSAAVGWSYISRGELEKACPDIFLERPEDLLKYV